MKKRDDFGIYRSIRPGNFYPYSAWEIDNSADIGEHEALVDVSLIQIDMSCFVQFMEEALGNEKEMGRIILNIVEERGKLHNNVTGTGGTFFGRVEKIGAGYVNRFGIDAGDDICSLFSLTGTPLRLDEIISVDADMAQAAIRGKAVLFPNNPVMKALPGLSAKVQLSAVEVAGQAAEVYKLVNKGDKVALLSAAGKMGLFCAMAAKKKLGESGRVVACIDDKSMEIADEWKWLFDEAIVLDTGNIDELQKYLSPMGSYDLVIDCSDKPMTEPACAMLAKPGGNILFAGWGGSSKTAGLAAEALGKDVNMRYYRGYVEGEIEFFTSLAAEYDMESLLESALKNDFRYPWMQMVEDRKRLLTISDGILENSKDCVFESPKSQELLQTILKVAQFDCNILITGETGTGKGIAAEIIHKKSKRRDQAFVKINCASIPETLLESELFGYEGGAFTGSNPKGKKGLWETADKGILFLDEIGEMSMLLQSKLLRAIEENEIYRVGGERPIRVDVQVIAATNRDLYLMVKEKKFREDLYYRLNVFYIHMPPLRERREDIIPLIDLMVYRYGRRFGIVKTIARDARELMETFEWEGNVRELDNFIQKLFISSLGSEITVRDVVKQMEAFHKSFLPPDFPAPGASGGKRRLSDEEERELYRRYKAEYKSTRKIAEAMGTSQSSVVRKLKKYNL